jgi:hypothetical protein
VKLKALASRIFLSLTSFWRISDSYEYKNKSARRGAQFVPIGMPTTCWNSTPPKETNMLVMMSTKPLVKSCLVLIWRINKVVVLVFNATFNSISVKSWRWVLLDTKSIVFIYHVATNKHKCILILIKRR